MRSTKSIISVFLAVLVATAVTGCGHNHSHEEASEGHAHDESLQLTAYSEAFEVYAEATPFVVGQQSDILAHFSFLKNFKPITAGSVTASLIVGTDGVRQLLEQPTRTGIYRFALTPATEGTGKIVFDIETPEGKSQLIVSDVRVYSHVHDAQHDAAAAVASSSNGVLFTKEQSWKVDFATEEVKREPFGQIIRTTAQIQPSQIDEKVVAAKASGIVQFSGNDLVGGKAVSSGQSLFSIESGGLAENNMDVRYNEAVSGYNKAKADYERKKALAVDRIVSERELQEAEAAYKNAEAVYNNLHQNFASGRQVIHSPMNGFVKQVLVRNGDYAEAGQPVLLVSQNRDLLIKAEIQPRFFEVLGTISTANIKVLNSSLSYTLEDLSGKVVSYGKSTDLDNPLIPVVFQVKNNIGLLPGSFVEMYIKLQTNKSALTVPKEALVEEMGTCFVFVQRTPELFEKRPVHTGATDGFRTEITEGLTEKERIVSKGAILVKLAQTSGALDAHSGHVH